MTESRTALSQAQFVQAATKIVDELGLNALTMRVLGDRLGVDATAVYRHFPSKERLVDALLDHTLADAARDTGEDLRPRDRITMVATNARRAFRAHPNGTGAMAMATGDPRARDTPISRR